MRAIVATTFVVLVVSCGGRQSATEMQDASLPGDAMEPTDGSRCETSSGVRICQQQGVCPWLDAPVCPGAGCTSPLALDDGGTSATGVCWSDVSGKATVSCATCDDGEACIQRTAGEFVCVPVDVCAALFAMGSTDVCLYADKHRYDGRALPPQTAACPSGLSGTGALCGGTCGSCRPDEAARCIGRSPDHPIGVCAWLPPVTSTTDPSRIPTCALAAGPTYDRPCPTDLGVMNLSCGVFSASGADIPFARRYGICLPPDICSSIAHALPGGFECYDPAGQRL